MSEQTESDQMRQDERDWRDSEAHGREPVPAQPPASPVAPAPTQWRIEMGWNGAEQVPFLTHDRRDGIRLDEEAANFLRGLLAHSPVATAMPPRAEAIMKAILKKIQQWRDIGSDPNVLKESRDLHAELADEMEEVFDSAEPLAPVATEKTAQAIPPYHPSNPLVAAIERGYKEWADGSCHEVGCGCMTVPIYDEVAPLFYAAQPAGTPEQVREKMQGVIGDLIAHHEQQAKDHVSSQWIYGNHMMAVKAYKKSLEILDTVLTAASQGQQGQGDGK
jgi:hypothetical protein